MFKFSLQKAAFVIFLCVALSGSALAQIYSVPSPSPAPTPAPAAPPAPAATPAPAPAAPAPMPTATPAPAATAGTQTAQPAATTTSTAAATTPPATARATVSTTTIPGYSSTANYSSAKTVAYVIAPFAVVAGTYFLGDTHQLEINPNA